MLRVMCVCSPDEAAALRSAFVADPNPVDLVCCDRDECVVDEVVAERPDVLVFGLRPGSDADLAVVWLLSHVAPGLPVVLMGEERPAALPEGMVCHVHGAPPAAAEILGAVQEALLARASA